MTAKYEYIGMYYMYVAFMDSLYCSNVVCFAVLWFSSLVWSVDKKSWRSAFVMGPSFRPDATFIRSKVMGPKCSDHVLGKETVLSKAWRLPR